LDNCEEQFYGYLATLSPQEKKGALSCHKCIDIFEKWRQKLFPIQLIKEKFDKIKRKKIEGYNSRLLSSY
jgi:hypothetical protein